MTLTFILHSSCITFLLNFTLDGGISRHKCRIDGEIGKITIQMPWKFGNFPVLAIFFQLPLPRIWLTHPNRNLYF